MFLVYSDSAAHVYNEKVPTYLIKFTHISEGVMIISIFGILSTGKSNASLWIN